MTVTARARSAWGLLAFLVLAACVAAAEPDVRNVSLRGLQVGGTTTLTVEGDALGTAPRLLLPFPVKQERKAGATDKQATFDVTLPADVVPGYYNLRVATEGGVSLPVVVGVDRLPQRPFAPSVAELPIALHGVASGSSPVETAFAGKAGQKVIIEVEAQRLGSKLRPVIHLYGPQRLQMAWSWGKPSLAGDARLEATLPEDGMYTVAVHDAEYAPPAPSFFRLKIGQWSFVDQVFPPVVGKGKQTVELLGSPAAPRLEINANGPPVLPLPWPKEGTWSGARPFVTVSPQREVIEDASAAKGQELPASTAGVSGRLLAPYEEDRYRIPVRPGSKVRLEVFAERLGSPLDVALVVRDDKGSELARAEDSTGTLDPVLDYTVPGTMTAIIVGVVDTQGRGGPRGVYRLTVEPPSAGDQKRDFRLVTPAQRVSLPVGGRSVVPILVERRGYQGSIALSADRLPGGVTLEGTMIPAGADGALVTVRQDGPSPDAAITTWRGRGEDNQEQSVVVKGHPLERLQPWLATELALAPTAAKASDFQVDWRGLPADAGLVPAGKLALPVKLTRPKTSSAVRLAVVTSQLTPLVNNQPDPSRSLRQEKPVELAATAVDGEVTLLVPAELAAPTYDLTVQAELLSADRRTVLATAYAPVKRLVVRPSLVLRLDGTGRVEVKLDAKKGATVQVKGKVERREGLTGDVTLTLTGLPPGARADAVTVKAGANEFAVNVVLPPNVPLGEVKGLKLVGSAVPDPKQPNVRVRSREVEVTLLVQVAAK